MTNEEKTTRSESFRIDYPKTAAGKKAWNKLYGMNAIYAGKHWSQRRRDAEFWHAMTRSAVYKAQLQKRPFHRPVVITFRWNDRMDISNHAYIAKMIEDAVKGILITDDSRRYVRGVEHYYHDEPYIQVTLTEVENE